MPTKPTIFLVHGAWHGPECWKFVVPKLEAQGYKCIAPQMIFANQALPTIKLAIDQAQEIIEGEVSQGRDVVVVVHSFGGAVGGSAVNGYTEKNPAKLKQGWGKVIGLCYVCAFMPAAGKSLIEMVGSRDTLFHVAGPDGWEVIHKQDPRGLFYGDIPKEDQDYWVSQLKNQSTATFEKGSGSEGVYEGFLDVPLWYLICTEDQAIPLPVQQGMIGMAKEKGSQVVEKTLECSHSPFLSKPDETVQFIVDAATAFQG